MPGHDTEANKDIVRRVEAAWSAGDLDAIDELIAEDFAAHTPGAEMLPPGREGAKMAFASSRQTFPDRKTSVEDLFSEGDRVVVRVRMQATNTGGMEWAGVPANGKPVDVEWITEYRIEGGKVVETWAQMDLVKMMQQLGVMPAPEA